MRQSPRRHVHPVIQELGMGLDWNPMGRPKPGFEEELADLFTTAESLDPTSSERAAVIARFKEISVPPWATLGAPRVGFHVLADQWLKKNLKNPAKFPAAL